MSRRQGELEIEVIPWEPIDAADVEDLIVVAREVLDMNWTGRSTIPAPGLYPHQWNWDSGFIALGRSRYDQTRAEQELLSLFEGQWRTGMLPSVVFDPNVHDDAYFPGPGFWRSDRSPDAPPNLETSGVTQPPIHAFVALEMHRRAHDVEQSLAFLRRLFPRLAALHRYLRDRRTGDDGLAAVVHPWETGLDNSPAWDEAFRTFEVPPNRLPRYARRDLVNADPRDRPRDETYDRYVYLAMLYRDVGYDDSAARDLTPFLVEDPLFNALWGWSAFALAEIALLLGRDPKEFLADGDLTVSTIESRLWDETNDLFLPFDRRSRRRMTNHHSIVSFGPLVLPGIDRLLAERTLRALDGMRHCDRDPCYVFPSYRPGAERYDPRRYWRGPIWINTDWLLYRGCRQVGAHVLADEIRASIVELVRRNGFREYFDPHGEEGFGAQRFSWSAALFLDIVGEPGPALGWPWEDEPGRASAPR
jgi:hypothetical protein